MKNIVLIISDDMGYSDVPIFGKSKIRTPNLQKLASQGVTFTDAYVTAPVCTPSRMGILTGKYQQRFGIYDLCHFYNSGFEAFSKENTMSKVLKSKGYVTGLVGKWHMGWMGCFDDVYIGNPERPFVSHPLDHGFDEFVGIAGGMSSYKPGTDIYRGREKQTSTKYMTDLWGDEAEDFIKRHHEETFFLMLAFNAVHAPLEAKDEDMSELAYGEFGSTDRKKYVAMLQNMDKNIGKVMNALERYGISDNTTIAFINDNGGGANTSSLHTRNTGINAPLRGYKFDVYDGGIRVPMLLSCPGVTKPGTVYNNMVSGMDIFPTFLEAAGVKVDNPPMFDGVSLVPYLTGNKTDQPHRILFWKNFVWEYVGLFMQKSNSTKYNCALRFGKWKMVRRDVDFNLCGESQWELYDIEADIGEQHNLMPEYIGEDNIFKQLQDEYTAWSNMMSPVAGPKAHELDYYLINTTTNMTFKISH